MRKLLITSILPLAMLFTACEGYTYYNKEVYNRTSKDITLSFHLLGGSGVETLEVPAGTRQTYIGFSQLGANRYPQPCLQQVDSITAVDANGQNVLLDLSNEENWILDIDDSQRRTVTQTCSTTIMPAHLQ